MPKNPEIADFLHRGKGTFTEKTQTGVFTTVLGITCETWKMVPGGGGTPTAPGANQGTDGGHSEGNKPALFENPGSLRKKPV